ncbi:hypothetical protein HDU77_005558 [Chytriomyces hyalinus]|nr:hypothetical protein HDU77_005558 [Chytriomyces hyalinus]
METIEVSSATTTVGNTESPDDKRSVAILPVTDNEMVSSPTTATADGDAANSATGAGTGEAGSPILQSKDIVITYSLLLLAMFSSNLQELQELGYMLDQTTQEKSATEARQNHARRILSTLFSTKPKPQTLQKLATSPSMPCVDSYDKWSRGILEAVIWFNSLGSDDIDCLKHVQSQGVETDALLKILRLAVRKLASPAGVHGSHNMAVIVISNLLTSTFMYQGAFTLLKSPTSETPLHHQHSPATLRYDARMRQTVRKLTVLLLSDGSGADRWEQEKTRSFVQQRIEHSVIKHVVAEKKEHWDMQLLKKSVTSDNSVATVSKSLSRPLIGEQKKPARPASMISTAPIPKESVNNASGANSTSPKHRSLGRKPGLKIDTTPKPQDDTKAGSMMQWMYDGLSTPVSSVGSFITATLAKPTAASISEKEELVPPSLETILGVRRGGIGAHSGTTPEGLDDWSAKSIMSHSTSLHTVVCLSGLIASEEDAVDSWNFLPAFTPFSDIVSVTFNSQAQMNLSQDLCAFKSLTKEAHLLSPSPSKYQPSPKTNLYGLQALQETDTDEPASKPIPSNADHAFPTPPSIIDAWTNLLDAAQTAGKHLGQKLLAEDFGQRPTSLVGFGLGARVIYFALVELIEAASSGNDSVYSFIDSVYLIAAPVRLDLEVWNKISTIVNGRLVNAYSKRDFMLNLLRSHEIDAEPENEGEGAFIGSHPIEPASASALSHSTAQTFVAVNHADAFSTKVENMDLSKSIQPQTNINKILPRLMERIGFDRCFGDFRELSGDFPNHERRSSRRPSNLPQKLPDPPKQVVTEILFEAAQMLTGGEADESATDDLQDFQEFHQTPVSEQISADVIFEPSALLLEPLSRPGSNRTLDEDEHDREQARAWISSGFE